MCSIAGLQAIALTDHNTTGNCEAFLHFTREYGLIGLPGMELSTREEVHVICLFPTLEQAKAWNAIVYSSLPNILNRPERFGRQVIRDTQDAEVSEEPKYLLQATDIGIYDVSRQVQELGGIAYPAHIDRGSFSLLSNLGLWDPDMGFTLAEHTRQADMSKLPHIPYVISSDAHRLEDIPDAKYVINVETASPNGILKALRQLSL
jgi:PHP family Zn ribbon phosphoesterase